MVWAFRGFKIGFRRQESRALRITGGKGLRSTVWGFRVLGFKGLGFRA